MPLTTDVVQRIQSLISQRQQHADAIAAIDSTLAKVAGVLTPDGRYKVVSVSQTPDAKVGPAKKKRIRRKFAVSGENSVLAFVKSKVNPKGRDIEQQWKKEGRAGTAANSLSVLVKAKKLKRVPLKGEPGSRYLLA